MSVRVSKKKKNWWVGEVSSIQVFLWDFWNFFNFAKPLTRVRARWRNSEWTRNFFPSLFQAAAVFNYLIWWVEVKGIRIYVSVRVLICTVLL